MKVIGWRAWYADGSKYNSTTTRWEDLPDDGVIAIILYYDRMTSGGHPERRIMDGSDWYFKVRGLDGWIYGQNNDSPEENKKRYGEKISLKRGKWTDDNTMYRIQAEALSTKNCPCSE